MSLIIQKASSLKAFQMSGMFLRLALTQDVGKGTLSLNSRKPSAVLTILLKNKRLNKSSSLPIQNKKKSQDYLS